jgi:hypothetical protein
MSRTLGVLACSVLMLSACTGHPAATAKPGPTSVPVSAAPSPSVGPATPSIGPAPSPCVKSATTDPAQKKHPAKPPNWSVVIALTNRIAKDPTLFHRTDFHVSGLAADQSVGKVDVWLADTPCPGSKTLPKPVVQRAQAYFDQHYGRDHVIVWSTYMGYGVAI